MRRAAALCHSEEVTGCTLRGRGHCTPRRGRRARRTCTHTEPPSRGGAVMEEGRRILVVDDACDLRVYLERHDYIVLQAAGAKEAVAKVRTALPDLVVLVVMTPGMDGIEILHAVRSLSSV